MPSSSPATSVPPENDRILWSEAFPLLGFPSQQQFNHARRALQQVRDRETGNLMPYPDFRRRNPRMSADEVRRREVEFNRTHILVVPEWGGIKFPESAWTYSRSVCQAIQKLGPQGLAAAG